MTVIVYFDIKTTGFARQDDIVQIAAHCHDHESFNVYITPTRPVHPKATETTGIKVINGHLYFQNKRVKSISPKKAFKRFIAYLKQFGGDAILVSHSCFRFDIHVILHLAEKLGCLNKFKIRVKGYNDTLAVFRTVLQKRRAQKKKFDLKHLVEDYLPTVRASKLLSDARYDAMVLQLLVHKLKINDEHFLQSSRSIDQFIKNKKVKEQSEKVTEDSKPVPVITEDTKPVASGSPIKLAFEKMFRNSLNAPKHLFQDDNSRLAV